jgi:nicotinamidase-related amidase
VITQILPSLDTHDAMQVFHAIWLIDQDGNHPDPYTLVSADDVERGRFRVNPAVADALGLDRDYAERHLAFYTRRLAEGGKYDLTIWPYHAMLGSIGHALVSSLEEAIFFHTMARFSQPEFQVKGHNPLTEHYSILGPEVTEGPDGDRLGAKNQELIDKLMTFDAVVVAGQAKSHCLAWTVDDLLEHDEMRVLAERVYLLKDCTSPIVVPGAVDYTEEADAAFERFAAAGMHVVRSTDRLETWPGIAEHLSPAGRLSRP